MTKAQSKLEHKVIAFSYFIVRKILGPMIRIIWIKKVSGIQHIPKKGPAIIAFNHQSYFDFICFVAVSPRNIHFLSAEKFFDHKIWNPLMRITGQIKVNRRASDKEEVHNLVFDHLKRGNLIGIFPEGTRAPDDDKMLRAFTGVAQYAVKGGVPVIPVGLKGTYDVMSRFDKKPRFIKVVEIKIGEPILFDEYPDLHLNENSYRVLTNKIMLTIAELCSKPYLHLDLTQEGRINTNHE